LKLEQERKREEGGSRSQAREVEELRKILGDTLRRKDMEINQLKAQVSQVSNRTVSPDFD